MLKEAAERGCGEILPTRMRLHPRRLRATGIAAISLLCLMVRAPPHHRCHFPPSDGLLQGTVSYFSAFMSTSPEQAHWDAPSLNRRDQLVEQQLQAVSVNWGAADANMKVCCRATRVMEAGPRDPATDTSRMPILVARHRLQWPQALLVAIAARASTVIGPCWHAQLFHAMA